jgi:antitoxin ParD1/3/4
MIYPHRSLKNHKRRFPKRASELEKSVAASCQALTFPDRVSAEQQRRPDMGMNVNLTPQLEELVRAKVNSGMYTSASEVVREALRLMDEQDRLRQVKLEDLRREVRKGLDSGKSEAWDATALKAKARNTRAAKAGAA